MSQMVLNVIAAPNPTPMGKLDEYVYNVDIEHDAHTVHSLYIAHYVYMCTLYTMRCHRVHNNVHSGDVYKFVYIVYVVYLVSHVCECVFSIRTNEDSGMFMGNTNLE